MAGSCNYRIRWTASSLLLFTSVFFLGLLVSGCSGPRSEAPVGAALSQVSPSDPSDPKEYVIVPGDELEIKFFYNPELNDRAVVRPDGKISLQLIDEVQAAGLTPSQLDKVLTQKYSHELRKPLVTVIVRSFAGQRVFVGGEVNRQGLIDLTSGMTVLQAVINAGGLRETAKPNGVIVIRKGAKNRPFPIRVDLTKTINGSGNTGVFQLQPSDIVYVPKTWIAKANKFVNQYIENLLLYRGVSLGFSYEIHADNP